MNTEWGFYGEHGEAAWCIAVERIANATGFDQEDVAVFLDSRFGRHFADDVSNALLTGADMPAAIDAAVKKWMGWSISVATSKQYGIPVGLPYLTGFVGMYEAQGV